MGKLSPVRGTKGLRRRPPQELSKRTNKYMSKEEPDVEHFFHKRKVRPPFSVSAASPSKSKQPSKSMAITAEGEGDG